MIFRLHRRPPEFFYSLNAQLHARPRRREAVAWASRGSAGWASCSARTKTMPRSMTLNVIAGATAAMPPIIAALKVPATTCDCCNHKIAKTLTDSSAAPTGIAQSAEEVKTDFKAATHLPQRCVGRLKLIPVEARSTASAWHAGHSFDSTLNLAITLTPNALAQPRICRSEAKANTSAGATCWA